MQEDVGAAASFLYGFLNRISLSTSVRCSAMQCSRSHPEINAQGAQKSRFVRLHKGKLFTT
jgi:hypothetical protein